MRENYFCFIYNFPHTFSAAAPNTNNAATPIQPNHILLCNFHEKHNERKLNKKKQKWEKVPFAKNYDTNATYLECCC